MPKNEAMIKLLFFLTFSGMVWTAGPDQKQESASVINNSSGLLIICDLQGALFFPKTANQKVAAIQNPEIAQLLKKYHQQDIKLLYVAEHLAEPMFWQNSIKSGNLPVETNFNLSNEIFQGFENNLPSCRLGIVLCQGQPFGEILGIVINQLWVWTQFLPEKIIFYTTSKQRSEIVTVIGNRIGATVEVKLVPGIVGTPPILISTKLQPTKLKQTDTVQTQQGKQIETKQPLKESSSKPLRVSVSSYTETKKLRR
jgi:hypothetical protein